MYQLSGNMSEQRIDQFMIATKDHIQNGNVDMQSCPE